MTRHQSMLQQAKQHKNHCRPDHAVASAAWDELLCIREEHDQQPFSYSASDAAAKRVSVILSLQPQIATSLALETKSYSGDWTFGYRPTSRPLR